MKLLRLRAYYEPECVAGTHMYKDIDEAFSSAQISCYDVTPMPTRGISDEVRNEYKHLKKEIKYDGYIVVRRFAMMKEGRNPLQRALRYLLCNIAEYNIGCKAKDIDIVYCASTPPTQGMLGALVAKKLSRKYGNKVPFIYELQDIFPDSLVNTGMAHKGGLLWKIGRKIEDFTYNHADKIIVISQGFKRNIMEKGVPEEKIEVISNWIDLDSVHPVARKDNTLIPEFGIDPNKFIVVYAGNFGAAQGADIVLKAAKELEEYKDIQFVIFGGGPYFEAAKKEAEGLENVFIHELMPQDRISEVYSLGDVALITCKAGTGKAGMPSKTWSIMACNTPIIASFDTDSDLAEVILDAKAGVCVEPEDAETLANAIATASSNRQGRMDLRSYVEKYAAKKVCVNRYIDILKEAAKM